MYGGTAQKYVLWKMEGEPYKRGNAWYVRMIHPITKYPTEVRWYTDKAHADLMPQAKASKKEFQGKCFGFEDENDYVLCIRDRDLTNEEVLSFFENNWKRGGKWRYGMFFGGVWYAPKDVTSPPIKRSEKVFRATWKEWVETAKEHTIQMFGPNYDGFWTKQEV